MIHLTLHFVVSDEDADHFESLLNYEQTTFSDGETSSVNIEGNEESWNELDIFNVRKYFHFNLIHHEYEVCRFQWVHYRIK